MRRGHGDELLALAACLLSLRGYFREVARGRRVGFFAGAVEAFPDGFRHARMLRIERFPFAAQLLDFDGELGRIHAGREQRFGALAELEPRLALAERFPALELRQLLDETAQPLDRRLRQHSGVCLGGADLVGSRSGRLQLTGGQRLLGRVQQAVHVRARQRRDLLRRLDLRQPALLDDDQRGLEALRERGSARRAIERAPALRKVRMIDGRGGRELLGLDDERLGAGKRMPVLLPAGEPLRGFLQHRERGRVVMALRDVAQRRELTALQLEAIGLGGGLQRIDPFAQPPVELRARALLVALPIEAFLDDLACGVPARVAWIVAGKIQRLPALDDVDDGADDRSRFHGERLQLLQNLVGRVALSLELGHGIEALARKARNAAILVLRGIGDLAQALGGLDPSRGVLAGFGEIGRQRDLHQQRFVADARDREAAPFGIVRMARDVGADAVGASVRGEERRGGRPVRGLGNHAAEGARHRRAHRRIGFRLQRLGERRQLRAPLRRRGTDFRCGVRGEQCRELPGIRRQRGDALHPLRRIRMLVQRGTGEDPRDHSGAAVTIRSAGSRASTGR